MHRVYTDLVQFKFQVICEDVFKKCDKLGLLLILS